jgi:dihydrofolate reductase
MTPPLAIVAAIARNGVIGAGGGLPWNLPSDRAHFRALTMGKPMLMGRKTFQSIGRALPGRETIVLTRDINFKAEAIHLAHDLETALALAVERAKAMNASEIILAGGADLYAALIGRADRMYITFVESAPEGDVHFPVIDWSLWREASRLEPEPRPQDETRFSFVEFRRR